MSIGKEIGLGVITKLSKSPLQYIFYFIYWSNVQKVKQLEV